METTPANHPPTAVEILGRVGYLEALARQRDRAEAVSRGAREVLMLVEHDPVVTLGKTADRGNIVWSASTLATAGIEVVHCERGGDVTYHGPGQLVGYPILDLSRRGKDVAAYVHALEDVLIDTVGHFGLAAARSDGRTGVWVGGAKIAAIGIHVSRWVTRHGFALNVAPRLDHFAAIIPCGLVGASVTSLAEALGEAPSMDEVVAVLREAFHRQFDVEPTPHGIARGEHRERQTV